MRAQLLYTYDDLFLKNMKTYYKPQKSCLRTLLGLMKKTRMYMF